MADRAGTPTGSGQTGSCGPGAVQGRSGTHEGQHQAGGMDWPCRYGDAECPVLPAEPGSGMRTVSSWNQATGETVLAPSVVDEVPCLQVVRQLIADLRASRAREARYRENYEFQQAAAQRFYTERGELQQRINKALAELDAHDAENDYRRMAHQQRLSPVRLARVRTALTGTDFADG